LNITIASSEQDHIHKNTNQESGVVVHTCNPSYSEADTGG
jgi:hypothetical protein